LMPASLQLIPVHRSQKKARLLGRALTHWVAQ
jgi:hypothetical protein